MKADKIAVIIKDAPNQFEGLRSTLALAIEIEGPDMFVIGDVQIPEDQAQDYKQNLEYLKNEFGGTNYTDVEKNVEEWGCFKHITIDDMAQKLKEYDLVIPF